MFYSLSFKTCWRSSKQKNGRDVNDDSGNRNSKNKNRRQINNNKNT